MAYHSNGGGNYSGDERDSRIGVTGSAADLDHSHHLHRSHHHHHSAQPPNQQSRLMHRQNDDDDDDDDNDDDDLLTTTTNSTTPRRIGSSELDEGKPVYLLEHLATFTVNKETGIVYPSDGMRRLLQLEKTTGIWSQKMQLCLDNQWILIMDYETGNIIERFPATLIQEPTAFTSQNPMEMYNNILVFIVAGGSGTGSRSEMHIFQSQSVSAVLLVEDLKQLRNGKIITQQHHQQQRGETSKIRAEYSTRSNNSMIPQASHQPDECDSESGAAGLNDETLSIQSNDKYERDVTVLNHCFDDIEKFIARLQHAAAASRELERRRRNRKSKKKDPGEGLLTLRTRPPHEKEFIDIFAKFKLSFNLLAKLKSHIHDPNAPELVHFLFTPLALIVEAATDTYYELNLPANCIQPLLTREAINLLINCVTSKETELWRSLGDCWTISRDQWKNSSALTGNYHPVFFDGWSPDYPVIDELGEYSPGPQPIKGNAEQFNNNSGLQGEYDEFAESPGKFQERSGFRDFSTRSDISIDSMERSAIQIERSGGVGGAGQQNNAPNIQSIVGRIQNISGIGSSPHHGHDVDAWLSKLQSRYAKVVQVTYPRTANNDKELTVVRGEYLEILDDSRKWWKARNIRGQVAHVPHTIVALYNGSNTADNSPDNENLGGVGPGLQAQNFNNKQQARLNESEISDPASPNSAEWIRNKHIGTKGEFRYF